MQRINAWKAVTVILMAVLSVILFIRFLPAVAATPAGVLEMATLSPPSSLPSNPTAASPPPPMPTDPPTGPLTTERTVISLTSWQNLGGTCPVTPTISNVFWDTPPKSGSVAIFNDEQVVLPGPEDEVRVIIQLKDEPVAAYKSHLLVTVPRLTNAEKSQIRAYADELRGSQQRVISEIKQQGIELKVRRGYNYIFNGLAASIRMKDMKRIRGFPEVKGVYPDHEVHVLLDESVPLIGADQVWAMGVTGAGSEVAIIDTGIDYTHPDLGGCFGAGCKVVDGYDFVNDDADPWDDHGHGTHCAGIVAANGTVKGVAPDASLYAYKVLNEYGGGWDSAIIAAIERATDPDGDPATDDAVDVISMSLGGSGDPDEPLALAVDAAVDEGVVVAVAAGNNGSGYQTVSSPGVARKAFTVGATDKSDNIAGFSSRGPVAGFYELIKPDIVAPGVSISSTVPISGELGSPDRYLYLSGTSMATPHIAGAAALIKQLHPDWTSEMIKANLMNTAKELGLDIYTQGAGRVRVNEAAVAQAVVVPGSVGFGVVDVEQPLWARSEELQLTNPTASSVSYALQVTGDLPTGVITDISPADVTLGAGESVTVTLAITVDNALVPYQSEEPGAYEGKLMAESAASTLAVPFAFIKSPILEITFDEEPWIVMIHDRSDRGWLYPYPGTSLFAFLPEGTYDIWVIYTAETWVIREGVVVSDVMSLSISRSEAVHEIAIAPLDKDGQALSPSDRTFAQVFTYTPSEIWIGVISWGSPPMTRYFSEASTDYTWWWRLDTSGSDFYEFNDGVTGISGDLTYQNDPAEFKRLTYHCYPDLVHTQAYIRSWTSSRPYGGWSRFSAVAEMLTSPFVQDAYYMPFINLDFRYAYTFIEVLDSNQEESLHESLYLLMKEGGEVDGYLPGEQDPLLSTTSDEMSLGLVPPHWFGKFSNDETQINIGPALGYWSPLFLYQMSDVKTYDELPYELYQSGLPVSSGTLPFMVDSWEPVEIPLAASGAYTLVVSYNQYWLGETQGEAHVIADFDTSRADKNPPFLTSLNVLVGGEARSIVPPSTTSQVKFNVEDDTNLGDVSLFYRTDGSWIPLSLTHGSEYTAQIPGLPNGSYVSLKLVAEDSAGNSLTYEMLPAFMVMVNSPVPISPPDGWVTEDTEITFTWNSVPEAASYRIQIDTVDTFDSPSLMEATVTSTEYTATFGLGAWYWHVLAIDGEGNESLYSSTWHFTVAEPVVQVTTDTGNDYDPSIVQAADGTLWVAWYSYRFGNRDIWYKTSSDDGATWSAAVQLTTNTSSDYAPSITQAADGTLWVVWYSYRSGNADIWYKTSADGGITWSAATQLTTDTDSDYRPAIAQVADGTMWVVWYSYRSDNADIWYKTSSDGGAFWSAATQLTTDTDYDYYPSIAQAADGTIWVIWQRNGLLWYRTSSDGGASWSAEAQIDGNCCHYRPSLMVDGDGAMWLASERNDDIWYQTSSDNGATWSAARQWTRFVGYDDYPYLAALSGNRVGLVWQSRRGGDDDIWFGIFGEREDVSPPPYVSSIAHIPSPNPDSDDVVTFRARARDETSVASVHLVWEFNEVSQADAPMYDDGAHNDDEANDDWYGVQLGPFAVGDSVSYTIRATDGDGNTYTYPGTRSFQVLPPFVPTADILFVPDYGGNDTDWFQPYFINALDDLGYAYDVWDTELRGAPDSDMLAQYVDGVIIWAAPYWGYIIYSDTFAAVQSYLDSGGRLFLTSQDTGYYLNDWGNTAFLNGYLHAMWVQDDTELYALNGTAGDPIGDGLALGISGGDGANNQYDTDEIDPISPAVTVFAYDTTAVAALAEPVKPEVAQPEREGGELGEIPLPVPWREFPERQREPVEAELAVGLQDIDSSGTGGLRVDTGAYKVVFFSFGFEGINSASDRAVVMERVLAWLRGVLPRPTQISPADGSPVPVGDVTFTWNSVAGASGYQIQIDTVDTFDSPALIDATVTDPNYTATLSLSTWYWRVRALPDGEFTTAWQVRAAGPVVQVTTDLGSDYDPSIVQAADGTLWVVWYSRRSGNSDIWYKTSPDGGATWSAAAQLTTNTSSDYDPAIAQAADGTLWAVWYSYRSGNADIWYKTSSDGGATWSAATQLTTDTDRDYEPAIAQATDGTLWVVWYSYRSGNADIWGKYTTDDGATWSAAVQLTTDSNSDYRPEITSTSDEKLWLVWYSYRTHPSRVWYMTSADNGATWSPPAALGNDSSYVYDPTIAQTPDGTLWVGWHSYGPWDPHAYYSLNTDLWTIHSTDGGATWSVPARFTRFTGYDERPSFAAGPGGTLAVAWQSDRATNYDVWFGVMGQREDVNPPPHIDEAVHDPAPNPDNTQTVTIRALLSDNDGIASATVIWTRDGVAQPDLTLYDDGAHDDYSAGDGWYGAQLAPFPAGTVVDYHLRLQDTSGNVVEGEPTNWRYPTYFVVQPQFVPMASLLLVADDRYRDPDWFSGFYTDALEALSHEYDLWNTYVRGVPDSATLAHYDAVIWAMAEYGMLGSWPEQDVATANLQSYLDAGGKLFISGQNVAYYTQWGSSFLQDYLHASYVQDDPGLRSLTGVAGDPIGDGLTLGISGGDGANNQWFPDEIDPISPAVTVFTYDTTAVMALAEPIRLRPEMAEPKWENGKPGATLIPVPWGGPQEPLKKPAEAEPAVSLQGIDSSGTGGLRVNTGAYKVVFFSFGFEAINNAGDRTVVMERVLNWLIDVTPPPEICCVHTTNVRDISFTVSWLTNVEASGEVRYGTDPASLDQIAYDDRGVDTSDDTHYVTLQGLTPETTYYFDVGSGPTTDDNDGAHYTVTTGPTLGLPPSDTIYGQVFKEDGTTPAEGAIVYITLRDADGSGSSDQAATLAALVDSNGYWYTNLGNARTADLTAYFDYSASGDRLGLDAQGAGDGIGYEPAVDTSNDSPAPTIVLSDVICVEIPLQIGWNHISLPVEPLTPYTAEDVCREINDQGGDAVEIDRWYASGWDGHICGLPFNDFPVELGSDYFIKSNAVSTWTICGYPVLVGAPLDLQTGWNSIGVPHSDAYTAESLCDEIISQGVTAVEIDRWYAGGWDGHICGLPFNDFPIEIGKGYFVKAGSSGTVTPSFAALSSVGASPLAMPRFRYASGYSTQGLAEVLRADGKVKAAIAEVKVTNVRDTSFTVSWSTNVMATGWVNYGTSSANTSTGLSTSLNQTAYDDCGANAIGKNHHVTIHGLSPQTTYYFEVVSGATVDDHEDSYYQAITGPTLELPASDSIYGRVFEEDGLTPAEGVIVYVILRDADGVGDPGEAGVMSALVDSEGWWHANLGNARLADGSNVFAYSAAGDVVTLAAQSAGVGLVTQTIDTGDLRPAAPLISRPAISKPISR